MTLAVFIPPFAITDLLQAVAPVIAGLGVVSTVTQIIRKQLAERHFSSLLAEDKTNLQELETIKPRLVAGRGDPEAVNEANNLLRIVVARLGEKDQKQLMEGLSQPGEKSRTNYIVKLVAEGERASEGSGSIQKSDSD